MLHLLRLGVSPAWACCFAFTILQAAPESSGWRSAGPFGASVERIVFSGKSDRDLLAITSNAFLYRTTDGGDHWTLIRFPAQHVSLAHALVIDPHRAGSFVVGVSSSNPAIAGLYQTFDDGQTWKHVLTGVAVFSAAYAPSEAGVIAAGTRQGVQLTKDAGANWKQISPVENKELQPVMSLGFDPRNTDVLYAGTPHLPWKTANGGQSWTSIHYGMLDDSDILALIVNQQKPEQLFIGACSGIYRTDNAAVKWTKLLGITGAGFRTYSVALDPAQPDTVYSGTRDGLWRSGDLGKSWRKLAPNIVKAVAVSPANSKILFLATEDAGVLRSRDGGETFHDASTGLADRRMIRMSHSGRHAMVTMGRDAATFRTQFDGGSLPLWKKASLPSSNSQVISTGKSTWFASSSNAMWKSADHGLTWKPLPVAPVGLVGTGVTLQMPLAATAKSIYRLAPNGLTWQPATLPGTSSGPIRKLWTARSGNGPAWIEAGASVLASTDGGKTWAISSLPVRGPEILEIDATADIVYVATSRGLFRSKDTGKTWTLCDKGIDSGSTTAAVAVHPANSSEAFAVQYGRIFRTLDGGESWNEFPVEGLQGASIASLSVSSETGDQLIALTSARGVFLHELVKVVPASAGADGASRVNNNGSNNNK
jgi:photosystem II stability/assembly factor-like uncharacterized protein